MIRQAIRKYEFQIAEKRKEDPKEFYNYIGNKNKVKPSIGPLLIEGNKYTIDDKETAEHLNNYFKSIYAPKYNTEIPNNFYSLKIIE